MSVNPPYVPNYGTLGKVLDKIKVAAEPPRFTQDFLSTKLGFKGGPPKLIIPYLKKIGLLNPDGTPTQLYRRFRSAQQSGAAMAEALCEGYKTLYERNEYAHDMADKDLKGLIVEVTGSESNSSTVKSILGSFKTLKERAAFGERESEEPKKDVSVDMIKSTPAHPKTPGDFVGMNLSYTINLNLPETSDINVFNAIFKSLKDNLLKK